MTEYMNNREICGVCFGKPEEEFILIKHHVSYFPEKVLFVHFKCHQDIHDPDNPLSHFIQYEASQAREFYDKKIKAPSII